MKKSVFTFFILVIGSFFITTSVNAQYWSVNLAYAGIQPISEFSSESFNGMSFSVERNISKRFETGMYLSFYIPKNIGSQGFNQYSTSHQKVNSVSIDFSYNVIRTKPINFYLKTGYIYINHTSSGKLRTFIDHPVEGSNRVVNNFENNYNSSGIHIGTGLSLNLVLPIFLDYKVIGAKKNYTELKIGFKIPLKD